MKQLGIAALLLTMIALSATASTCEVEVLFVSPVVDQTIEPRIIEAVDLAEDQVLIALYSFTDDELGAAVVRAHLRGVAVYILMDDGQDSDSQGREWPNLVAAGVPVAIEHETGLLHHKFVVIDGETVITGSYNWSDSADDNNFENSVFIQCEEIATQFVNQFCYIARYVIGLDWPICPDNGNGGLPPSDCLECLALLNSATESQFNACPGIGDTLAPRLVQYQPYSISGECTRAKLEGALQEVPYIGPARSQDVIDCICGDLFD